MCNEWKNGGKSDRRCEKRFFLFSSLYKTISLLISWFFLLRHRDIFMIPYLFSLPLLFFSLPKQDEENRKEKINHSSFARRKKRNKIYFGKVHKLNNVTTHFHECRWNFGTISSSLTNKFTWRNSQFSQQARIWKATLFQDFSYCVFQRNYIWWGIKVLWKRRKKLSEKFI